MEYSRFMPRMGITRLANVTGLDRIGLPVYLAIRPNSRALAGAQGKGFDADAAKVSALMEAIEGWHGERIDRPLRYESFQELRRHAQVVDVFDVGRRAGAPLRLDLPMLWIEGWDLLERTLCWLPFEAVSTNFVKPPGASATFLESTNGLASGNHLLEAIAHGLCEVIERDAVTLSTFDDEAELKSRQLDLATVEDPLCRQLLDRLDQAGIFTAAWDVTSDLGIPTYTCTLLESPDRPRWRAMPSFSGHGCHLEPGIALLRAVSEAVQSRLTVISGSRDDMFPRDYAESSHEDDQQRMLERLLTPAPGLSFRSRASLATDTFEGDVEQLLAALRQAGIRRAVVVDLSRPEIGVPVVKVVVPGLEAFLTSVYQPGKRAQARRERRSAA